MSDSNPFDSPAPPGQNDWVRVNQSPARLRNPSSNNLPTFVLQALGQQEPSSALTSAPTYLLVPLSAGQQIGIEGVAAPPASVSVFATPAQQTDFYQAQPNPQAASFTFAGPTAAGSTWPAPQLQLPASQGSVPPTSIFSRTALSQIQTQSPVTHSRRPSSLSPRKLQNGRFIGSPVGMRAPTKSAFGTINPRQTCKIWNQRGDVGCKGNCSKAHICKKCFDYFGETEQHPACECDSDRVFDKEAGLEHASKRLRRKSSPLQTHMDVDTFAASNQGTLGLGQGPSSKSVAEDQPCVEWNLGLSHSKICKALHVCRECFALRNTSAEHREKDCFYYHRRIHGMDAN